MNSPEKSDNTPLIAGAVLLFGGAIALVTGDASWKGHHVQGPLATVAGISFLILGAIFIALHVRNRMKSR